MKHEGIIRKPAGWASGLQQAGGGAALIAVAWFWHFSGNLPAHGRALLAAGLGALVLGIYRADRSWDKRRAGREPQPPRAWRAGWQASGVAGLALALACGIVFWRLGAGAEASAPLRLGLWVAACTAGTLLYYQARRTFPSWGRGRPLVVATIFWAGVAGPPSAWSDSAPGPCAWGFLLLLWMNARICLSPQRVLRARGFAVYQVALGGMAIALFLQTPGEADLAIRIAGVLGALVLAALPRVSPAVPSLALTADLAIWAPALAAILWR